MADISGVGKGGAPHFPPERGPEVSKELRSNADHTRDVAENLVLTRFDGKPLGGRASGDRPPIANKVHDLLVH